MSMRIVKVGDANAKFAEKEKRIIQESAELAAAVSDAIESVDPDTKNRWCLNGFNTCRVAYVDATAYLPEAVVAVSTAFRDNGYLVNTMTVGGEEDPMVLLAVVWDPNVRVGVLDSLMQSDETMAATFANEDPEQAPAPEPTSESGDNTEEPQIGVPLEDPAGFQATPTTVPSDGDVYDN